MLFEVMVIARGVSACVRLPSAPRPRSSLKLLACRTASEEKIKISDLSVQVSHYIIIYTFVFPASNAMEYMQTREDILLLLTTFGKRFDFL